MTPITSITPERAPALLDAAAETIAQAQRVGATVHSATLVPRGVEVHIAEHWLLDHLAPGGVATQLGPSSLAAERDHGGGVRSFVTADLDDEPDGAPVTQAEVTTPAEVYATEATYAQRAQAIADGVAS